MLTSTKFQSRTASELKLDFLTSPRAGNLRFALTCRTSST